MLKPQQCRSVSLIADDSKGAKSSALDINAGLKLSCLDRLISAKYLDDRKSSNQQSRFTMKYKCATELWPLWPLTMAELRPLTMDQLDKGNVQYPDVFDKGEATHVVTGKTYGAQYFFVFDAEVTSEVKKRNVGGGLHAMVKAMPSFQVDGKGSITIPDDDKKKVDKFIVIFYGDFVPSVNPTAFAEAVKLYKELPQQLGPNNEKAVPVTVYLYPLEHLDSKAVQLVREISAQLVSQTQDSIERLNSRSIRCNDLGKTPGCRNFPVIRNKVGKFHIMVKDAKNFINVYKANTEATDVTFIVADDSSVTDKPGALICLYEGGKPIDKNFKPPSAPGLLHETQVAHDELTIRWEEPYNMYNGSENNTHFRISHKTSDAIDWVVSNTTDAARGNVIHQLLPSTKYQVKVNAVCMACSCEDSAVLPIITRPTNPPGKPKVWKVSALKIGIEWTRPNILEKNVTIHYYAIERCLMSRECKDEWICCFSTQTGNQLSCDIPQGPQAPYRYRVIANCGKQDSLPSAASDEISTEAKSEDILKETIREGSEKIGDLNNPSIYQVQLEELAANTSSMVRKRIFGKATPGVPEKVILLVGATGTGKTTFMNGILNYILSVEWKNDFRFRLDDEGLTSNQAYSQTQWVTEYTLNYQDGFRIPYTLTIVDTPGFGDTTGIQRDKEIVEQLKQFFSTIHIDAIGFLTQASLPRLTHTQKFVFDIILSLFGKDIAESIYLLITFADGKEPPVLAGVKEAGLPYKKYFKFNNSALYASQADRSDSLEDESDDDDDGEGLFDEMFWRMAFRNYKKFLNQLATITGKTLVQTNSVLEQKQRLEKIVTEIQTGIKLGLNELEKLQIEQNTLYLHMKDIKPSKSFTYKVRESTVIQKVIPSGSYTTNCLKCNFTCHYPCDIPDDDKSGCDAMTRPGHHCGVCPHNCHWSLHLNQPYTLNAYEQEVTKTFDDLKERYSLAKGKSVSAERLMQNVMEDYEALQMNVMSKTNEARKIINRLQEIALKPNPLSTVDYIDILIESEKSYAKVGWMERVQQLIDVRKKAETLATMAKDGYDPFEEYNQVVAEAKAAEAEKEESNSYIGWMRKAGKFLKGLPQ